jgi:hypothetical protein
LDSINPIIDAEPEIGNPSFRVFQGEAGKENLPYVGLPVAIRILQVKNIRRGRND